ncbi:hypothetical protein CCACVL1_01814 [Corchorus capsularis]|uniref:Uncharacterized protein n=1 Tax=Corchorus capsularis TaxID=210143 RepID=A0A1R3KFG4_COCAP|nr:hypothetical protein CCACVL1_01814 [Corchorus capsularis]
MARQRFQNHKQQTQSVLSDFVVLELE